VALCAGASLLMALAGLAAPRGSAAAPCDRPAREVRLVMGTTAEIEVSGVADPAAALGAAFAALERVDESMSLWRPSELARLNAAGEAAVSADLLAVLARALEVAEASGGAFDPTVEPLVRAAGQLGEPARQLDPSARRALLGRVGAAKVRLDARSGRVTLEGGARLDLGAIAKGYAVDLALQALRAAGARAAVVDLGGSSVAAFGAPVEVAIADPAGRAAPPWGAIVLDGAALGTSGAGERGAHVLDPRTGAPARRVLSATVVGASAMEADALSTAAFVLGAEEGLALVERRGAEGFVLLREGGRRVLRATAGFGHAARLRTASGVEVITRAAPPPRRGAAR